MAPRSEEEAALLPPPDASRWVEVADLEMATRVVLAWAQTPAPIEA